MHLYAQGWHHIRAGFLNGITPPLSALFSHPSFSLCLSLSSSLFFLSFSLCYSREENYLKGCNLNSMQFGGAWVCVCAYSPALLRVLRGWESTPCRVVAPACSVFCSHATVASVGNPRCRVEDSEQDEGCAELYNFKVTDCIT